MAPAVHPPGPFSFQVDMRSFPLLLALLLVAGCSGRPPLAKDPPKPVDAPDSLRLLLAIEAGKDISYALSSDRFPELNGGTVSIRGMAPGVGSFEYSDKAGKVRLSGRIDEHGALSVQRPSEETGDYLLFMSLLFLLPKGALGQSTLNEEVALLPDPLVYVFGKASWTLGGEEEFLDRPCRLAGCETSLDIAGRQDGKLTGRMKARLVCRYDAASKRLLAVEARVKANYRDPAAVDSVPETTILVRLRE